MFRSSRAGGVHRLGADTSSMRSGWGRWKQDGLRAESAGLAEAQPEHLVQLSKTEVEQHELTHLPLRSWCRRCVRAKGAKTADTMSRTKHALPTSCLVKARVTVTQKEHATSTLQSDQEPSITGVKHKASTHVATEIVYEESSV